MSDGAFLRRAVGWWLVTLALAVTNGVLRQSVLIPALGPVDGTRVSGVILSAVVVAIAAAAVRRPPRLAPHPALRLGMLWLVLTVVFEFSLGFAQGKELSVILAPYRFEGGNLWPVVLLLVLTAPWLWSRL